MVRRVELSLKSGSVRILMTAMMMMMTVMMTIWTVSRLSGIEPHNSCHAPVPKRRLWAAHSAPLCSMRRRCQRRPADGHNSHALINIRRHTTHTGCCAIVFGLALRSSARCMPASPSAWLCCPALWRTQCPPATRADRCEACPLWNACWSPTPRAPLQHDAVREETSTAR